MDEKYYIYIIQMHTKTLPSRFIKFLTRYEYSHVAIALKKDCKTTYSFGRRKLRNVLSAGFVEEHQNGVFFRKYNMTKCRIYEIEVNGQQYRLVNALLEYRKQHRNIYKYDFLGIILRFFKIPIAFENKAVCSQFVAEILEEGEVMSFDKPSYFVKPKDFDNRKGLKVVYEGRYSEYQVA